MPATTIDGVIGRLQDLIDECITTRSRLGYFAALYKRMTMAVKDGMKRGVFDDNARIEALDVMFANRYLATRAQYLAGELQGVCWLQAYGAAQSDAHVVLQQLLVAMNPHIMLDLGVAAARTCPGAELAGLAKDFATINAVIYDLMPVVDAELDALSPVSATIDHTIGRFKGAHHGVGLRESALDDDLAAAGPADRRPRSRGTAPWRRDPRRQPDSLAHPAPREPGRGGEHPRAERASSVGRQAGATGPRGCGTPRTSSARR